MAASLSFTLLWKLPRILTFGYISQSFSLWKTISIFIIVHTRKGSKKESFINNQLLKPVYDCHGTVDK